MNETSPRTTPAPLDDRAIESAQRIREIIARMTRITRVEASGSFPGVPAMLDIRRSSEDN